MKSMTKMEKRREFCSRMGWKLQRPTDEGNPDKKTRIIGAEGVVLLETGGNYNSGYIDGLMDGLDGKPFTRHHGADE